jgi:hypothetical protein
MLIVLSGGKKDGYPFLIALGYVICMCWEDKSYLIIICGDA